MYRHVWYGKPFLVTPSRLRNLLLPFYHMFSRLIPLLMPSSLRPGTEWTELGAGRWGNPRRLVVPSQTSWWNEADHQCRGHGCNTRAPWRGLFCWPHHVFQPLLSPRGQFAEIHPSSRSPSLFICSPCFQGETRFGPIMLEPNQ